LLPPWPEGEGGADGVSKSWVITLLCGQSASACQAAIRFGLGGSCSLHEGPLPGGVLDRLCHVRAVDAYVW